MVPSDNEQRTGTAPSGNVKSADPRKSADAPPATDKGGVQGEGDYAAAREFNEAERKFVASGKVAAAARAAAPKSEEERREMMAAEAEGKRRAKEEDPALAKASPDSATPKASAKNTDRNPV